MKLVSGNDLEITLAPFADSKALYQAVLKEARGLDIHFDDKVDVNLFKNAFCTFLGSAEIEKALAPCLGRATYNGLRITKDTFEDENARGDYFEVCFEVAKANILPFVKSLFAKWSPLLEKMKSFQK